MESEGLKVRGESTDFREMTEFPEYPECPAQGVYLAAREELELLAKTGRREETAETARVYFNQLKIQLKLLSMYGNCMPFLTNKLLRP